MRTLLIITLLTTHPLQAAEILLTSVPTPIQTSKNAATKAWATLPNKADPIYLDHFIATYPQSDEAQIAFTLRFNGVQISRSISHYHAFIKKYQGTLAAEQALFELFELYRQLVVGVEVLHCPSQPQFGQNSSRINRRRLPKVMPIYYYEDIAYENTIFR